MISRALAIGLSASIPTLACATTDGWPALHDVVSVAENDVLNIRGAPNAGAEIVGSFPHDATSIEIVRPNDPSLPQWGLVNVNENQGWVSLQFLERHPGQFDGLYPDFAFCAGTEPFWSMHRKDGSARLNIFLTDRFELSEPILWETGTVNHRLRYSFGTESLVGVISRQYCDDGMSDNEFGLELNLVLPQESLHLQGCCSLEPRE